MSFWVLVVATAILLSTDACGGGRFEALDQPPDGAAPNDGGLRDAIEDSDDVADVVAPRDVHDAALIDASEDRNDSPADAARSDGTRDSARSDAPDSPLSDAPDSDVSMDGASPDRAG